MWNPSRSSLRDIVVLHVVIYSGFSWKNNYQFGSIPILTQHVGLYVHFVENPSSTNITSLLPHSLLPSIHQTIIAEEWMQPLLGSVDSLKQKKHTCPLRCDIQEMITKSSDGAPMQFWKLSRRQTYNCTVTMFLLTIPWSRMRYQYIDEGGECRYQDRIEELPRSSLYFVHQFTAVLSKPVTNLRST